MDSQKQIWEKYWQEQDYVAELEVKEYHVDIKTAIDTFCPHAKTAIEIGSGIGITSLILSDTLQCTLLDFDEGILQKAKALFEKQQKEARFICCDMFHLDTIKEKFDVVFNSGVLEHYTVKERRNLLMEYQKTLNHNGIMLIAVPNHYCLPYKIGYIALRLLRKWQYPPEFAIKDFSRELKNSNLHCVKTIIASNNLIENNIQNKFLRKTYRFFKTIFRFQGYLRIFIIQKLTT